MLCITLRCFKEAITSLIFKKILQREQFSVPLVSSSVGNLYK